MKGFGFERAAAENFELDTIGIGEKFLARRSQNPKYCSKRLFRNSR